MGLSGQFLVATPLLLDPNFVRSVVVILDHDEDGAFGVVVNRPSDALVDDLLPAWRGHLVPPQVVFVGGPVSPETGIGLALAEDGSERGMSGLAVVDVAAGPADERPVRVFSGYSGWGPGQLESELNESAWLVAPASPDLIFEERPDLIWGRLIRSLDPGLRIYATFPTDADLN